MPSGRTSCGRRRRRSRRRSLHVDRQVRHGLRPVEQDHRAGRVRASRDLGDRVDRAEHVRDVGDARPASRGRPRAARRARRGRAGPRRRRVRYSSRAPCSWHSSCQGTRLEWCSISRDQDHVAGADVLAPPGVATRLIASVALRTKTISLGRRADEVAPPSRGRPRRAAVGLGRQLVHAAMDVRVRVAVVGVDRLDHRLAASARSRRCRDRRAACRSNSPRQDREVGADLLDRARQGSLGGRDLHA